MVFSSEFVHDDGRQF